MINTLSSASSEETVSMSQHQPIRLSKKQSHRTYKALATGLFGGAAVTGIASATGVGVGAAVWGATALTMVAAGPIGVGVGATLGVIGLGVLTGVLTYCYKKSKKLKAMETTL